MNVETLHVSLGVNQSSYIAVLSALFMSDVVLTMLGPCPNPIRINLSLLSKQCTSAPSFHLSTIRAGFEWPLLACSDTYSCPTTFTSWYLQCPVHCPGNRVIFWTVPTAWDCAPSGLLLSGGSICFVCTCSLLLIRSDSCYYTEWPVILRACTTRLVCSVHSTSIGQSATPSLHHAGPTPG